MATNTTKWLIGCGIGCLTVIIIAAAIVGGGFLCVKSAVNTIQETEQSQKELQQQYGGLAEYVPNLDGSVAPSRMEAFLAVRARLAQMHPDLVQTFETLPHEGFRERAPSVREVVKLVRTASSVLPLIADYIQTRNEALMNEQMGFGEYFYIHTIAYHSYLGFSPSDGPEIDGQDTTESDVEVRLFDDDSTFGHGPAGERYRRNVLALLRNQRNAIPVASATTKEKELIAAVDAEITAMERNRQRIPWGDGLPPAIEHSLEPYRDQLEKNYCESANIFDLFSPENDDWDFEFHD
jgi:hypothetical protein